MTRPAPEMDVQTMRQFFQARVGALAATMHLDAYERLGRRLPPGGLPTPVRKRRAHDEVFATVCRDAGLTETQLADALAGKADTATLTKVWRALGVEVPA